MTNIILTNSEEIKNLKKQLAYYTNIYIEELHNIKIKKYKPIKKYTYTFICSKCEKTFSNKRNYDSHVLNKICEKTKPDLKCDKCNKIFTDIRSLNYHNEHNVCTKNETQITNTNNPTPSNNTNNSIPSNPITNNPITNNNTNNSTNIQTQNNQTQNIQTQNNQNIININIDSTKNTDKIAEMIPFRTCGYKITPKKYLEYAKYPERAIKSFIKDEHFNPEKPERMNVLNTNYKSTKVSVLDYDEYDEMRWMLKSKNDINGLLCDRVINHLFMAKIMLQNAGIKLDAETEKKLNEQINDYESNEKVKKKYLDMVSELSYNYRDMVEENKRKYSKLQIKN